MYRLATGLMWISISLSPICRLPPSSHGEHRLRLQRFKQLWAWKSCESVALTAPPPSRDCLDQKPHGKSLFCWREIQEGRTIVMLCYAMLCCVVLCCGVGMVHVCCGRAGLPVVVWVRSPVCVSLQHVVYLAICITHSNSDWLICPWFLATSRAQEVPNLQHKFIDVVFNLP